MTQPAALPVPVYSIFDRDIPARSYPRVHHRQSDRTDRRQAGGVRENRQQLRGQAMRPEIGGRRRAGQGVASCLSVPGAGQA